MKLSRIAFAVTCAVFISHSAHAASLTMLQFGSFETRAEAQKRLAEVTAKHSAQLGKLATNVREVKLPPDNLTVYRTQAGPLESRAAAQAICSQLASVGDECYIVQTAMASTPEKTPTMADAKNAVTAPVASAVDSVLNTASKAVDAATPELPSTSAAIAPARDPLNRAALGNVASALTDAAVPSVAAPRVELAQDDAAASQVNKALDAAVRETAKSDDGVLNVAKNSAAPSRGFWSRLNPFDDEPKAPVVKAPEAVAAPVDSVAQKALAEVAQALPETPEVPSIVTPKAEIKAPEVTIPRVESVLPKVAVASAAAAPAVVNLSRAPITLDRTPVIMHAEPLPLPPPPAPLRAQDRAELAAGIKPKLPAPEVIAVSPIAAPTRDGSVQVEEAKRVPVTQAIVAPQAPQQAAPFATRSTPSAALSPTASDGQKTIWAQVGPFASEQAAIAYWSAYRQNHPDFPVVRVRATTPLQTSGSKPQSWLRVGPVANAGFVTSLCGGLVAEPGLRCGVVRDSGVASDIKNSRPSPASRYKR